MSETRLGVLLKSIEDECKFIGTLTEGMTEETDLGDTTEGVMKFRSLCFGEQNIGEAAIQIGHITQDRLFEIYPSVPWKQIKGMKNHIVHEYMDIDPRQIISTAVNDIPILEKKIHSIRCDLNQGKLNKLLFYMRMAKENKNFIIPEFSKGNGIK